MPTFTFSPRLLLQGALLGGLYFVHVDDTVTSEREARIALEAKVAGPARLRDQSLPPGRGRVHESPETLKEDASSPAAQAVVRERQPAPKAGSSEKLALRDE